MLPSPLLRAKKKVSDHSSLTGATATIKKCTGIKTLQQPMAILDRRSALSITMKSNKKRGLLLRLHYTLYYYVWPIKNNIFHETDSVTVLEHQNSCMNKILEEKLISSKIQDNVPQYQYLNINKYWT